MSGSGVPTVVIVPVPTTQAIVVSPPVGRAVVVREETVVRATLDAGAPGAQGPAGPQGPPGPPGGGTYEHAQLTPATLWTVNHNLGRHPSVTVVDSGDNVVYGDVTYLSANALTIAFGAAFGGKAYIN